MHEPAMKLIEDRIRRIRTNHKHYISMRDTGRQDVKDQAEYEITALATIMESLDRSLEALRGAQ